MTVARYIALSLISRYHCLDPTNRNISGLHCITVVMHISTEILLLVSLSAIFLFTRPVAHFKFLHRQLSLGIFCGGPGTPSHVNFQGPKQIWRSPPQMYITNSLILGGLLCPWNTQFRIANMPWSNSQAFTLGLHSQHCLTSNDHLTCIVRSCKGDRIWQMHAKLGRSRPQLAHSHSQRTEGPTTRNRLQRDLLITWDLYTGENLDSLPGW